MTCEQFSANVDALVLGALTNAEATDARAHLASCSLCAAEYRSGVAVAERLPMSVPLVRAPASLRSAVLAAVAADGGARSPGSASLPSKPAPVRTYTHAPVATTALVDSTPLRLPVGGDGARTYSAIRRGRLLPAIAAVFAGLAIIGLSAWTTVLQRQVHDLQRQQLAAVAPHGVTAPTGAASTASNAESAALVLLSSPATVRLPLGNPSDAGPSGAVFWSQDQRRCVVLARQLAPAGTGLEYHVWFRTTDMRWDGGSLIPDANGNAETVVSMQHWQITDGYTVAIVLQPVIDDGSGQAVLSGEIRTQAQ